MLTTACRPNYTPLIVGIFVVFALGGCAYWLHRRSLARDEHVEEKAAHGSEGAEQAERLLHDQNNEKGEDDGEASKSR